MDGIANDADVLFLLSTNSPEMLEPALASRPGRIDQAIMIPLPDEDCRTRLCALYGAGLPLDVKDMAQFVQRTDGASAAFIREWFRKSALLAAQEVPNVAIQDRHLDDALNRMQKGSAFTGKFLGYKTEPMDVATTSTAL